jgi:DNA-binding PadR family transcriptional regulator
LLYSIRTVAELDKTPLRPSPLAMTVLLMLVGEPLHPYEMQRRIKLWGKDQVVNVAQRANLYKTIERLHHAGLIAVRQTERDQRFPERTVYELTEAGFRVSREWLIEMLETPRNEFPRFPAALSFIMMLAPEQAREVLERRALAVRETLADLERVLSGTDGPLPPRITLIETEYLRAMTKAELDWLCSVIDELHSGTLTWSYEELAEAAKQFLA